MVLFALFLSFLLPVVSQTLKTPHLRKNHIVLAIPYTSDQLQHRFLSPLQLHYAGSPRDLVYMVDMVKDSFLSCSSTTSLMEVLQDKDACRKCQTAQEETDCNAFDDTFVSDEVENKNSEAIVDAEDDDNDLFEDALPSGEN